MPDLNRRLKEALRSLVPASWRPHGPKWEARMLDGLVRDWREKRAAMTPIASDRLRNTLIVPPDTRTVSGSRGDDAMLAVVRGHLAARRDDAAPEIIAARGPASDAAIRLGFAPTPEWPAKDFVGGVSRALQARAYREVYVIGADIMDGYYSPLGAAKNLILADLAARCGSRTTITGFSFSPSPAPELAQIYDELHEGVRLRVRDAVSLERVRKFTRAQAFLAADLAFLLEPGPPPPEVAAWIDGERAKGRRVLGLNVHPMLVKSSEAAAALIDGVSEAAAETSAKQDVSWLLLPHDFRDSEGDHHCLKPIKATLDAKGVACFYVEGEPGSAVLKGIASKLDGVVSGRMHLAIATLGSGVPVLAITYAGKFAGLFRHFSLPDWLLLEPTAALRDMSAGFSRFAADLAALRPHVEAVLPNVKKLSQTNFSDA